MQAAFRAACRGLLGALFVFCMFAPMVGASVLPTSVEVSDEVPSVFVAVELQSAGVLHVQFGGGLSCDEFAARYPAALDAYLVVRDSSGVVVAEDDDGDHNAGSNCLGAKVHVELPAGGYVVEFTRYGASFGAGAVLWGELVGSSTTVAATTTVAVSTTTLAPTTSTSFVPTSTLFVSTSTSFVPTSTSFVPTTTVAVTTSSSSTTVAPTSTVGVIVPATSAPTTSSSSTTLVSTTSSSTTTLAPATSAPFVPTSAPFVPTSALTTTTSAPFVPTSAPTTTTSAQTTVTSAPFVPTSALTTTTSSTTSTLPLTPTSSSTTSSSTTTAAPTPPTSSTTVPTSTIRPAPPADATETDKQQFEAEVDIYATDAYTDYVPAGSTITVGERRTIVAATVIVSASPVMPMRRRTR